MAVIGDIHGCWDELCNLVSKLGGVISDSGLILISEERELKLISVGDLLDRGPKSAQVLNLFINHWLYEEGRLSVELPKGYKVAKIYCALGNHDFKYWRYLQGRKIIFNAGMQRSADSFASELFLHSADLLSEYLHTLPHYFIFDEGKLLVSHAGLSEEKQSYQDKKEEESTRRFCLYGDVTGEFDEDGFPIRLHWEEEYHGKATVVYGHTVVKEPQIVNNTYNIDTGCVFGGKLTALLYPSMEFVSVPANQEYFSHDQVLTPHQP